MYPEACPLCLLDFQHLVRCHAFRKEADAGDIVSSQLTATLASVLKLGWLDANAKERHSFFAEVESLVTSQGSNAVRKGGIRLLEVGFSAWLLSSFLFQRLLRLCSTSDIHCKVIAQDLVSAKCV
jgi:hypothetical protein